MVIAILSVEMTGLTCHTDWSLEVSHEVLLGVSILCHKVLSRLTFINLIEQRLIIHIYLSFVIK